MRARGRRARDLALRCRRSAHDETRRRAVENRRRRRADARPAVRRRVRGRGHRVRDRAGRHRGADPFGEDGERDEHGGARGVLGPGGAATSRRHVGERAES